AAKSVCASSSEPRAVSGPSRLQKRSSAPENSSPTAASCASVEWPPICKSPPATTTIGRAQADSQADSRSAYSAHLMQPLYAAGSQTDLLKWSRMELLVLGLVATIGFASYALWSRAQTSGGPEGGAGAGERSLVNLQVGDVVQHLGSDYLVE